MAASRGPSGWWLHRPCSALRPSPAWISPLSAADSRQGVGEEQGERLTATECFSPSRLRSSDWTPVASGLRELPDFSTGSTFACQFVLVAGALSVQNHMDQESHTGPRRPSMSPTRGRDDVLVERRCVGFALYRSSVDLRAPLDGLKGRSTRDACANPD